MAVESVRDAVRGPTRANEAPCEVMVRDSVPGRPHAPGSDVHLLGVSWYVDTSVRRCRVLVEKWARFSSPRGHRENLTTRHARRLADMADDRGGVWTARIRDAKQVLNELRCVSLNSVFYASVSRSSRHARGV